MFARAQCSKSHGLENTIYLFDVMIAADPVSVGVHTEIFRVTDNVDYGKNDFGGRIVALFTLPSSLSRYHLVLGNQGNTNQRCDPGIFALEIEGNVALVFTAVHRRYFALPKKSRFLCSTPWAAAVFCSLIHKLLPTWHGRSKPFSSILYICFAGAVQCQRGLYAGGA